MDRRRAADLHSGAYRRLLDSGVDPTRTEEWTGDLHTWGLRLHRHGS